MFTSVLLPTPGGPVNAYDGSIGEMVNFSITHLSLAPGFLLKKYIEPKI